MFFSFRERISEKYLVGFIRLFILMNRVSILVTFNRVFFLDFIFFSL